MVKVINFSESGGGQFETDLSRVSADIKNKKENQGMENIEQKEIVKQSLETFKPPIVVSIPQSDATSPGSLPSDDLPIYLNAGDLKIKAMVESLIQLTFKEGIEKSFKEAMKSGPFVLDALHDSLTDKLLPELKKRGLVE